VGRKAPAFHIKLEYEKVGAFLLQAGAHSRQAKIFYVFINQ